MGGQVSTSGSFRSLPCTTNADWMSALCPVLWDVPLHQLSIPGAGCHGAAGRGRAVPGPADRTHAGRLGEEPALCAHGVHDGAGGGHAHGDLRVAGEPPPGGGHPGLQGLRGHDGRPARVPGRLHQEHLWGHAVSARGEEGPWGRGWAGLEGWAYPLVLLCMVRGEVCCVLRLRSSGCPERRRPGLSGAECSLPEAPALPAHRRATSFAPQEVPTLNQMWSRGQQVILSYEEDSVVNRHAELWPGIPYWWGDQVKPQELIRYLERMKSCGRPGGLFVAGINLTENLAYVLGHPTESLRKMTLPSLPCLRAWVREQSPGPGAQCTNIIAGDFIGVDAFVGDVIRLNEKLLRC
ncbi:PI-PLC X domain-containing protein 1 isoform X3 [Mustela erminea]|uniref:PI-PLC X domain-containing protein 1 isoform X3 n=1 Tax=Mustela erminea TaxID=36723 RepID=UPI001386D293|nr:PI-PLC X domain-containing protein 1 isoform X3 [Mustela erminea]